MPSDETPPTTLETDLRRLGLNRTADDLNDLVALATRKRWSTTVMLERIVGAELEDRQRRSVERRLTCARLGRFKPLADWDWDWPTAFDRPALERILTLDFLARGENVILVGAQGLGKTMLAKNIAHQAILAGHSALFTTAADLLLDLNGQETARALERRLRHYTRPSLVVCDELGYLAYDARAADLRHRAGPVAARVVFQLVSRRYEHRSLLITTNLPFKHWDTVFPNASCAVALIDRLTHHVEILVVDRLTHHVEAGAIAGARPSSPSSSANAVAAPTPAMTTTRHRVVVNGVRRRVSRNDQFLRAANIQAPRPATVPRPDGALKGGARRGNRARGTPLNGLAKWWGVPFMLPLPPTALCVKLSDIACVCVSRSVQLALFRRCQSASAVGVSDTY